MIYIVLGMHKSGTTLISQILHSSGINMGQFDQSITYDHGNKYERENSLALDLDILGADSYDVLDLPAADRPTLSPAQHQQMSSIIGGCATKYDDWGMKDPRMCLTYPLWAKHLPPHKLIVVYRDAAQVWPRFKWRGKRGFAVNFGRAYNFQKRWIEYNRSILTALQANSCENIVLSYHDLMTDDAEFNRLQTFVGRDLVDHRQPGLYRNKSHAEPLLRTAGWLLEKRTGLRTSDTFTSLQELRTRGIATARLGPHQGK